jgi:hypothetical protein
MSTTIVDMPKLCQALDNGWMVTIEKNALGSYTAEATHPMQAAIDDANVKLRKQLNEAGWSNDDIDGNDMLETHSVLTDDFTPEQALTRLAYKVHGEII